MANDTTTSQLLPQTGPPGMQRLLRHNDVLLAVGIGVVLTTLLIPMPTGVLDWLLAGSIALAIATLVVILSVQEAIEFSAFPSLLLCLTLFRLSLNVASTRLILMRGSAGRIIETFGVLIAGNDLVIGLVVFLILVVIQFVVITKGAERISEVAARFNLDAMPGKQMAIDADLNAGLIGEQEARERRQKIVRESEFYGAMDGASKFVRGDAIAGLIITGVNLVGGIIVGLMNGMTAGQAASKYSILAVGDGLVSQIPAVIISTASGFLITKTSSQVNLSSDLTRQFLARSRPLGIAAFLFAALMFVPNFPALPFGALALGAGLLSRRLAAAERAAAAAPVEEPKPAKPADEVTVEDVLDVDRISVQVGTRLVKLVDPRRKTSLAHRIAPLRRKFAQQYGVLLPLVRLRDNVGLEPSAYEIRLNNHLVGRGQLESDKLMAMDPGTVATPVAGQPAQEPVFNLPALWIVPEHREQAELAGYTVVDPESILMTHLSEMLRRHACELLTRDDVQKLLDRLRETQPTLVASTAGDPAAVATIHRVLQGLLRDGIPVRDLPQILESVSEHAGKTRDVALLTEVARKALVRTLTEQHSPQPGRLDVIVLEPTLEHELRTGLRRDGDSESLVLAPERAGELCQAIADSWQRAMDAGFDKAVLLCDYRLRRHVAAMLARQLPQLSVLAYDEVAIGTQPQSVGTVALRQLTAAGAALEAPAGTR